jgi:hypothetical protein
MVPTIDPMIIIGNQNERFNPIIPEAPTERFIPIVPENQTERFVPYKSQVNSQEVRNGILTLEFSDTHATKLNFSLYRYYPARQLIEPLTENFSVDVENEAPLNLGQIPPNLPGGQYLIVVCSLENCSSESIFANLDSLDISVHGLSLSPLVQVDEINVQRGGNDSIAVDLLVDPNLSSADSVILQWQIDGKILDYTTSPWMNFTQPYQELNLESGKVLLYPQGAFVKDQLEMYAPSWAPIFFGSEGATLPAGDYQLDVQTNNVVEESITFNVPALPADSTP